MPFNCSASLATCPACVPACGCILPSQRCDGVWYDCADGSDAQYCPGKVTPAPGQTDCQVLSPPALGSMTVNGLMFSNTTTFVCTSPYVLMGSAVRTCEINGQWSGVQPACVLTTAALSAASDELVKDSVSERMTQTSPAPCPLLERQSWNPELQVRW
ncbi:inactive serine protease PAMR1-like [Sycon ciliatum]|uniref:inactive serine protease PAMR1-like n=1 Tax=Sycon ciliatum TaxID=27933 RepID=UPI0031F67AFA